MIYLPLNIPCSEQLASQTYALHAWQSLQNAPMRVLLLNLMPQKEVTELDISSVLLDTGIDIQLIPIKIRGQRYKTTPQTHMEHFYLNFDEIAPYNFERLIITGAPVEQLKFEDVRYWEDLCRIMSWSDSHIDRTLYICWGAQAGLYYKYNIPKFQLPQKMFGIYEQDVLNPKSPLMSGLCPTFVMPNSRHTEIRMEDIEGHISEGLTVLSSGRESGVGVVATYDLREVYIVGHLEYEPNTLHNEYCRDLNKNMPIHAPVNYYDDNGRVIYSWRQYAITFYKNWLL